MLRSRTSTPRPRCRPPPARARAGIGLATVYRTLKAFMARGEVVQVEIPGVSPCYEPADRSHHHHFIFQHCRQAFDLKGYVHDLEGLALANFQVQHHSIILYGICAVCAEDGST
jgi:Fur family ferric uptake transcriptional regulator